MKKLVRITTIPDSLKVLLKGQLKFMNQHYDVIGVSGNGDAMEYLRQNEGIRTEIVEMTRRISPLKDLVATYKFYRLLKIEKPHIVHSHTPKAGIVGMLAAFLAGVPNRFHTVAGMPLLESRGFKRALLNFVEKLTYYFATKVFPNSKGLYDIILEEGFTKPNKLQLIGKGSSNGIDISHFNKENISKKEQDQLKKELGITPNDFVFVFVGRMVTDKGINELALAYDKLSKICNNTKLLLVGWRENDLDPLLPETEMILNSNPNIIEAGFQEDVRPYFAISNILVFPTYREGFPNVVLQAGAMQLPSIVTNINGCNEIIQHSKNGLIIPVKNVDAILESMTWCLNQHDHLKEMSNNSRDLIAENYQHTYIWGELLKMYQSTE